MSTKNGKPKAKVQRVKLSSLRRDPAVQARAAMDGSMVESCRLAVEDGKKLPPVVVFEDDEKVRWLAGGFHRAEGTERAGKDQILAEVRKGTRRDAILFAVGDNAEPGVLRRSNDDKRRAVEMLLDDPDWSKWSQAKIAKAAAVAPSFVHKIIQERAGVPVHSERINGIAEGSYSTPAESSATPPNDQPKATDRLPGRPVPADPETWRSPAIEMPATPPAKHKDESAAGPKAAGPAIDWAAFNESIRTLMKLIDAAGDAHGKAKNGTPHRETPAADSLRKTISDFKAGFEEWTKEMARAKR